ncbi:TspO/MBR family protein [Pontixanthobacter aestiaquae]|uniref:Tryptophan-rich sensory protein n=1 Tax=Pontixanthobacter aestiaquae TaxID=1509367 RepID=A0A844ZE01_9SPHN|nr:TspO/MBR family protein [Pontixanthobacter aestiaquae]MDN3644990.1 TspO/MBR family protein [Pontixanthobacter aestiaquae]MXO84009.1 tryptophan-rich sensory protein [Pontixanthobacter aestiaquae]
MNVLASQGQLRASFFRWALFTVPACLLVGFLAEQFGGGSNSLWFQNLIKPDIFPEPKWFGIVWTVLYIMLGIAVALICAAWGARGRVAALVVFVLHFLLAQSWTLVFFGNYQITIGLYVLGASVVSAVIVMGLFWRVRQLAALLLLPYLGWLCFATLLNYEFLKLNPDADGVDQTQAVQRIEL